jgi:hypothetical protein
VGREEGEKVMLGGTMERREKKEERGKGVEE